MRAKDILNEDWNKVNKKDKTDGLSQKAVNAYRRENPGSKLQTAVTTKPSKLKAGSKDAKRRKSFCARMSGNKGPMKDEKGRPTPKAKALRRWNCEEDIQQLEVQLEEAKEKTLKNSNPCWKGYKPVGTKKKAGRTVPNCVPKESLEEYGDTDKGQKMLAKVQKRAVDRVVSKKADTDPKYAKKNKETADRAWDRMTDKDVSEGWSQKYKNSINCSHPKGFSQKAHCAGKKKHNESVEMEMVCPDCGMCKSHGSLNEIKKGQKDSNGFTKCWPGKHAEGTKKGKNGGQVRNCVPNEDVAEGKTQKQEPPKPRNFVAKNAINTGAGAHKDKKKEQKQGNVKHKGKMMDLAEMEEVLERASRQLCKSSKPDDDLGASNLASCKSQGYRARDGEKSHLITAGKRKVRVKVGGKKIKGKKYGGPLPDYGTRKGQ